MKILIIGNGVDVTKCERGEFIEATFDDVLICNKTLFNLSSHRKYIGNPNIWGTCGWSSPKDIKDNETLLEDLPAWGARHSKLFDPIDEHKLLVHDILKHSNIREVWCNSNENRNELDFEIPENIEFHNIVNPILPGKQHHSLGLQSLVRAMEMYSEVYYMGIDSYRKGHHYYDESMPENVMTMIHAQGDYLTESMLIKKLVNENKIKHIDDIR